MAGVYFMGAKQGQKKSDGSWYGNATLLFQNSYGDWVCGGKNGTAWFGDKKTFESCVSGIPVGASISVFRDMAGNVVQFALNPEYPDIMIGE